MRIAVIIASTGRPDLLARKVGLLTRQTRRPDRVIVSVVSPNDVVRFAAPEALQVEVIFGDRGLPRQRNAGLRQLDGRADALVFFDDDFVPAFDYLERLEQVFTSRPGVVGATGKLIADGIGSAGWSFNEGVDMVSGHCSPQVIQERPLPALYGCNLCVRMSAAEGIWFDEALPLYGWQEDVDYSYQLGQRGTLVYTNLLTGVHLGTKGGRTSGLRLGYSQIANPVYLLRKRTIPPRLAWRLMSRNLVANIARSAFPEPHVDRFGRLRGNAQALVDLARGLSHPERILDY